MNRLKEIREDHDLLEVEIAQILNISQRGYSHYEREDTNIPIETLHKLADYYKTSIDYLLYRTDERKPYPKSILNN